MASLLQVQTQAAHTPRPNAIEYFPKKNSGSKDPFSSTPNTSLETVRCCQCQRSLSFDRTSSPATQGVVQFGMNSYYCNRCAYVVGVKK
jgi:hypothetical protein